MPAEETAPLTQEECLIAAEQLQEIANTLLDCQQLLAEQRGRVSKEIWVFRKPSLRFCLDRGESFQRELKRAMDAVRLGIPYSSATPKSQRSREREKQIQEDKIRRR
jgi:hypothetical protein